MKLGMYILHMRFIGEGFRVTVVPSRNRRNFHVSEFLEETKAASAVKFCTRITKVVKPVFFHNRYPCSHNRFVTGYPLWRHNVNASHVLQCIVK